MPDAAMRDVARELDHNSPADLHARTGTTLVDVITAYNDLATKFQNLIFQMDDVGTQGVNLSDPRFKLAVPVLAALGDR